MNTADEAQAPRRAGRFRARGFSPLSNPRAGTLAALLVIAWAVSSYTLLYSGRTVLLGRADLWGQFAPAAFYLDHALSTGDFPEWNPLVFCGVPFAANPQSAAFYPPNLLRAWLNAPPTPLSTFQSLALMQTLHLLALALGIYFLCLRLGLSRLAAAVAACAVVLSAPVAYRTVQHWTFIAVLAHLPWQLLALRAFLHAASLLERLRWAILLGLITGHSMLAGAPQVLIYPVILLSVYAAGHRLLHPPRERGWMRLKRQAAIDALCACAALILALGISAAALLPATEYAQHCSRAKFGESDVQMAAAAQVRQAHTPASVVKALLDYPGEKSLRFLGLPGALLLFCAVFIRPLRSTLPFFVMLLCMLDLSLGPPMPLAMLVDALAPFSISEAERAMLFGVLPMAVLAAAALDAARRPGGFSLGGGPRAILVACTGAVAVATLWNWLDYGAPWWMWGLPALAVPLLALAQFRRTADTATGALALVLVLHLSASAQDYTRGLAHSNAYPGDWAALENTAAWQARLDREIAPKWLENAGIFELKPVINGYDPLIPAELDAALRGKDARGIYLKRLGADDLTKDNETGLNLLGQRFHLANGDKDAPLPSSLVLIPPSDARQHIVLEDASPDSVSLRLSGIQERMWFVFVEYGYPGWRAYMDETQAAIHRVYGAFQAIEVQPGDHQVRMEFHSPTLWLGVRVSVSLFAVSLAALLFIWRAEIRNRPTGHSPDSPKSPDPAR